MIIVCWDGDRGKRFSIRAVRDKLSAPSTEQNAGDGGDLRATTDETTARSSAVGNPSAPQGVSMEGNLNVE